MVHTTTNMAVDYQKELRRLLNKARLEEGDYGAVFEEMDALREKADAIEKVQTLAKGADGKTPEKGKDYFTDDEIQEFLDRVTPRKGVHYENDGKDGDKGDPGEPGAAGYTPIRGIDYLTDEEMEDIVKQATPKRGRHYFTKKDIEEFKQAITPVKGRDYRDGASITIEQVIEHILSLSGKEAAEFGKRLGAMIDISQVRNAQSFMFNGKKYKTHELMHGGGSSSSVSTNVETQYSLTGTQVGSDVVVALSQLTHFADFTNVIAAMRNQIPQTNGVTCTITATDVTFLDADAGEVFSITYAYTS